MSRVATALLTFTNYDGNSLFLHGKERGQTRYHVIFATIPGQVLPDLHGARKIVAGSSCWPCEIVLTIIMIPRYKSSGTYIGRNMIHVYKCNSDVITRNRKTTRVNDRVKPGITLFSQPYTLGHTG